MSAVTKQAHIKRETLASAGINGVISVGFFIGVFGGIDPVPVWGIGNYAFDFVPQSFAIGLMASLVPGLLARKAVKAGKFEGVEEGVAMPGSIFLRAVVTGLISILVGAGLCALILLFSGAEAVASTPALIAKVLYGVVLGVIVTGLTLTRLLGQAS